MQIAALPSNETERLECLRQTGVLDTDPEESFDRLTGLAARLCNAPIALITLVDVDRQWFKSHIGVEVEETPRDVAFCAHAILYPGTMIVRDALKDERFFDNPLVVDDPKIRFYAGSPLVTHDGNAIGTFCVIDTVPRDLDSEQVSALEALSDHATILLELRRAKKLLESAAAEWERASEKKDRRAAAEALERLGEGLDGLIRSREQAETSFRELERRLHDKISGVSLAVPGVAPEIQRLLNLAIERSDLLLHELGPDDLLSAEVIRIGAAVRQARDLLG